MMVGQRDVVREVLICIIAGGHALLGGAGSGKRLSCAPRPIRSDLKFNRIQFTLT
ncbi:MAG: hypothetical protein R2839_10620 [Thermomicrobiales bacterium]